MPAASPLADRFNAKVRVMPNGCWQWTGHLAPRGYGRISVGRKDYLAHRVAYELFVGPIPDGLIIDHLCRNTSCVNPAHLEAVTHAENCLRGFGAPAQNARKTHCPQGHLYDEENTYTDKNGRRQCRTCSNLRRARSRRKAVAEPQKDTDAD